MFCCFLFKFLFFIFCMIPKLLFYWLILYLTIISLSSYILFNIPSSLFIFIIIIFSYFIMSYWYKLYILLLISPPLLYWVFILLTLIISPYYNIFLLKFSNIIMSLFSYCFLLNILFDIIVIIFFSCSYINFKNLFILV